MLKKRGRGKSSVTRGKSVSFYERPAKRSALLIILPILMVLVILVCGYLAYLDSLKTDPAETSSSNITSQMTE